MATLLIFADEDALPALAERLTPHIAPGVDFSVVQRSDGVVLSINGNELEGLISVLEGADVDYRLQPSGLPTRLPMMSDRVAELTKALSQQGATFQDFYATRDTTAPLGSIAEQRKSEEPEKEAVEAEPPFFTSAATRRNCWEAMRPVTSGWGSGTSTYINEPSRADFSSAVQEAYSDALAKAAASTPTSLSDVTGAPACDHPCVPVYYVAFPKIETSEQTLVSIQLQGEGQISGATEGGGISGSLTAKASINADVKSITVEIQWTIWVMCVAPGVAQDSPGQGEEEDDILVGTGDPFSTTDTGTVFGGEVAMRCSSHSDWDEVVVNSETVETRVFLDAEPHFGPATSAHESAIRREAIKKAADEANTALAALRAQQKCVPPCSNETLEINLGPVSSWAEFRGSTYGAYYMRFFARCYWYFSRECATP